MKKALGSKIKKIRLSLGLEQHEFADLIGVTKGAVWNWEHSKRIPRFPHIRKIVEIARDNNLTIEIKDFV